MARTYKMRIPGTPAGNFNPDRTVNYRLTTSGYTSFTLESEVSNSELIFLGNKSDIRRIDAIESNLSKIYTVLNSTSISDTDAINNRYLSFTGGTLTGSLTLVSGSTTVPTLRLTSGVQLTTPLAGAIEWNGTNLFVTQTTGPTRKTIAFTDSNITGSAASLTTARTIALSGDATGNTTFDGSVDRTIALTLASVATAGTYNSVVVNAKGLVTSGVNNAYLTTESDTLASVTGRGATTSTAVSITNATGATSTSTGALIITGGVGVGGTVHASGFVGSLTGNASTATALSTARTFALAGDISGSVSSTLSAGFTITSTLPNVATAGTYNSVVVNAKGLVTSGQNLAYLTSETDTLASVTGRGATTSTAVSITNTTASTSTSTGALVVSGGVGIGGRLNIGSTLTLPAGTTTVPALVLTSGVQLTTATAGAIEWNGTNLFVTQTTGPTRKTIAFTDSNITGSAASLTTARTIALSGDATGNTTFDGSADRTIALTLASVATAGTYNSVVVNAKGLVTSGLSLGYLTAETDTLASVTGRGATTSTAVSITNATVSTTTGTGALIVTGGVGIGGAVNTGGSVTAGGTFANNLVIAGSTTTNPVTITATGSDVNVGISLVPKGSGAVISVTPAVDNNTTQIATTAYVLGQAGNTNPLINGTATAGTSLRWARQDHVHPTDTTRAPLASPTFTGTVTLPAGTTTVPTLVLTSGVQLTTATAGAIEWNGTDLFVTQTTGPTRKTIAYTDGNITGNAATATALSTARTFALAGDISGSVSSTLSAGFTITSTLPNIATAGTYNSVVVNAKGLVTSGQNLAYLTSETDTLASVTGRGATTGTAVSITNATGATSTSTGALIITGGVGVGGTVHASGFVGNLTGNASTSTTSGSLATARTIALSGDATGNTTFDGSADRTIALTLASVATAGTYNSVVVNAKGLVTSGVNNAYLTTESDTLASVTGRGATTSTAVSITNATASTTTGTGALIVTGGVGIGGRLNIGSTLTLPAGTTTVPALVLTSGVQLTTATAGAIEWNGTNLFVTQTTGPTRKTIAFTDSNITGSAASLTTARTIALSGDATGNTTFDGSADRTIALTLASVATAGTYNSVVVNAKGLVTSGQNLAYLTSETDTLASVTGRGATTSTALSITNATGATSTSTGALIITGGVGVGGTLHAAGLVSTLTGNASTATALSTARTFALAGDISGSVSSTLSTGFTITSTLANTTVTPGTYTLSTVVVDSTGRITSASNGAETDTLQTVTTRGATTNTAISITNATASTTTGTGALIITGGVGIGGRLNIGSTLTLPAGTTTVAPLVLTSGTNLTTPLAGAIEWNGTNLFVTQTTGPTRKTIAFTDSNITGSAATLTTARTIALSGDATGNTTFDGSADRTIALTLASVATAGTYNSVVVNAKGLVTSGQNLAYLTNETDTLASVTGRGATTNTALSITNTTASTTTGTGALVVSGGLGIGGAVNTGGSVTAGGTFANNLVIAGSTTTNPVTITATGSDTNIGINLIPKGTGIVTVPSTNNSVFLRNSVATFFDHRGNLVEAPINVRRSNNYNPLILDYNLIENPTASGATLGVATSSGTNVLPTGWSFPNFAGWTRTVTAIGLLPDGRPYIDIRLQAAAAPGDAVLNIGQASCLPGEAFHGSVEIQRIAGSAAGANVRIRYQSRTEAGGFIANSQTADLGVTTSLVRYAASTTANIGTTTRQLGLTISWTNAGDSQPVDMTLRFVYPILVRGSVAPIYSKYFTFPQYGLLGELDENLAINRFSNPRCEGAVAGSPGTIPSNWGFNTSTDGTLTRTIIGIGYEDGIPYYEVRYSGTTPSNNYQIMMAFQTPAPAASQGQTWTTSVYARLIAGSIPAAGFVLRLLESGAAVYSATDVATNITTNLLRTQRFATTRTFTQSDVTGADGFLITGIIPTSGTSIDFTLRIGAPQLELGSVATSNILPVIASPAVTTREADVFGPISGAITVTGGLGTSGNMYSGGQIEIGRSSTNSLRIAGSNSGLPVTISAIGNDDSVGISLVPKGTGGKVIAPTPSVDSINSEIATTEFFANQAGSDLPIMDGTAAAGTSLRWARQDHVHPTDTTRAPLASPTFTGTVTLTPPATMAFGSTTRQMLNLWGTAYGFGVQNNTIYMRTGSGTAGRFSIHAGGVHSNTENDPGAGGTTIFSIVGPSTIQAFGNTVWHAGNDGAASGLDADLLDGLQGTAYARIAGNTFTSTQVLAAGTTTVAPLVLTSGTNLTTPLAGAIEWNGTNLFVTQTTGPTRKTIAFTDSNITGSAASLTTARTIALSGDATGNTTFDGSVDRTIALTLASVATAGTYNSVVVNAKGLVTSGQNLVYLTSETDTLASVTGRGATTTTTITTTNTTASTSTSTGALVVSGGVGIGGAVNIGGTVSTNSNIRQNTTNGSSDVVLLRRQTTNATATALTTDGAAQGANNQIILINNSAEVISTLIVGRNTANGDSAAWELRYLVKRGASAAATSIVGTITKTRIAFDTGASTWDVTGIVDTTNGGTTISVTGAAATTINWTAKIRTVEAF